jgi:hypothetical protein
MRFERRAAWFLVAAGGLAAVAALFAPSGHWHGLDAGATGASAFVICVILSVWLFATRSDQIFPEHMSITERRTWVGVVFLAIVLASFAREMLMLSGLGEIPEHIHDLFAHRFLERYFSLAIAWGVIAHLVGQREGGVEVDERDLRLRHRADRAGDWAFTLIVIGGIIVLASVPRALLGWWLAPIVLANVLIGLLIAKSLVEHVVLACSYRSSLA